MGVESNNQGNQLLYLPDGVLPMDYPEVYEELLSCCCVQLIRSDYQFHNFFICQCCCDTSDPDDRDFVTDEIRLNKAIR